MAYRSVREVRPTAHCIYVTSGADRNTMKVKEKTACLFFDQINNNAKLRGTLALRDEPSTELSTVIVDNLRRRCQTKTYTICVIDHAFRRAERTQGQGIT